MQGYWWLLVLPVFWLLLLSCCLTLVTANSEGDALHALRQALIDPKQVLQSWDPTLVNPCTWFHVTCDTENNVIRVDLGNASLSGTLVPQLGNLPFLQYLELYSNSISGSIPSELGALSQLVSLDLYVNDFTGDIPSTLGQLANLRFLRLNNNSLTGAIPLQLTSILGLQVLDLSFNNLSGYVPTNGSFSQFTPISFQGNSNLCGPMVDKQCPGEPPLPPPPPYQPSPCPSDPSNNDGS
ncbi:unnamed protein product [Sphagnum troendelagicum]